MTRVNFDTIWGEENFGRYLFVAAAPWVCVWMERGVGCAVGGERAQAGGPERVEVAEAFGAVEVGGFVGREEKGVFCV